MLTTEDHRRDSAGMTYVYPVVSRRAGGVSIGINLNVNSACNWACIYCQVENLKRGGPPPVDLACLHHELESFLTDALDGDFMARAVPVEARRLEDIAFSGNGEPTCAAEFAEAVAIARNALAARQLLPQVRLRLITNGANSIAQLCSRVLPFWVKMAAKSGSSWIASVSNLPAPSTVSR